jgi:hypothetical protein
MLRYKTKDFKGTSLQRVLSNPEFRNGGRIALS